MSESMIVHVPMLDSAAVIWHPIQCPEMLHLNVRWGDTLFDIRWKHHVIGCLQIKMHWVCGNYWKPGPDGNDIHKTNVPNLRMRFRYDCHSEELNLVMSGAAAHDARRHAKIWE